MNQRVWPVMSANRKVPASTYLVGFPVLYKLVTCSFFWLSEGVHGLIQRLAVPARHSPRGLRGSPGSPKFFQNEQWKSHSDTIASNNCGLPRGRGP